MSYSDDYRKRVVEYRQEGHTLEQTHQIFKVAIVTIRTWEKQIKEKGKFERKKVDRPFRKIDPQKLTAYIEAHPDAYLKEIALEFKCCQTAVRKALKRQNITRKKRPNATKNRMLKK